MPLDLERFLASYKGGVSVEEGLALSRYATGCVEGAILEIGSYRGKSAVAMAHGLGDASVRTDRSVFCVDPHKTFTGVYGGHFGPQDRGDFYRVMLETGYFNRVALINLESVAAARGWRDPIGLLFIDGDHTHEAVRRDVDAWELHVMVGGVIAFDDATNPDLGPFKVLQELTASGRFARIERVGKTVFVRKLAPTPPVRPSPLGGKRIAVVCNELSVAGGLFRFEHFGRIARTYGHETTFIRLSPVPTPIRETDFAVMTFDQAARETWDVTIVPGASFPAEMFPLLRRFERACFGLRMQHVLNDQTRKQSFLDVNSFFRPHVVVFNNRHWQPGSFTSFQGNAFHFCEGGVDVAAFAPDRYKSPPRPGQSFVIGGLAHKNPGPLLDAVRALPPDVELRLFGPPADLAHTAADLVASGRLTLAGVLAESALPDFYRGLDCVVHTRTFAGWANLAAEAMACGVPVICTPHGTLAFAQHEHTALVIREPTPAAITEAVERLRRDPDLVRRLSHNARERITEFSWERYTADLLRLMESDARVHYTWAPALGLFGKWPIEDRLRGLEPALEQCKGKSVLDLGAAEGVIAHRLLEGGAALVHGFERDAARAATARALCKSFPAACFWQADLSVWSDFVRDHAAHLLGRYDVVLYLGLHHHLPKNTRLDALAGAADLASDLLVVRAPENVFRDDDITSFLAARDLVKTHEARDDDRAEVGTVRIFQRRRLST